MPDIDLGLPEEGGSGKELIVHPTLGRDSVAFQQVVRYVEKLQEGIKPQAAAKAAGTTLGAMKLQGRAVQKYLAEKRSEYTATADDLRELAMLQWVERALRKPGDDGYIPGEAMAALREISLIPEVGLKGKPGAAGASTVRQLSEETQSILDRIDLVEE